MAADMLLAVFVALAITSLVGVFVHQAYKLGYNQGKLAASVDDVRTLIQSWGGWKVDQLPAANPSESSRWEAAFQTGPGPNWLRSHDQIHTTTTEATLYHQAATPGQNESDRGYNSL